MSRPWVPTALETTTKTLSLVAGLSDHAPPIVKEIFLVATRISEIVETINKNRDALHDLNKRSIDLAKLIERTLGDRKPGEKIMKSLGTVTEKLLDVEAFMEKYRDMNRLEKIWTNFAKSGEVTELKNNLLEARQNFKLAAALDTNIRVVAMEKIVKSDARFDGGIFCLHDAEVDMHDGRSIFKSAILEDGPFVHYYRATVRLRGDSESKLLIIRIVERPTIPSGDAAEVARKRLEEYDEVLRLLTEPACQHRFVARMFGMSGDEPLRRFIVLKLDPALTSGTKFILKRRKRALSTVIALKLMDAAAHLSRHGIDWVPRNGEFCVDQNGEPIIGLDMDLRKKTPENAAAVYETQISTVFALHEKLQIWTVGQINPDTLLHLTEELPHMLRNNPSAVLVARSLSQILSRFTKSWKVVISIPKSDLVADLAVPNLRLHGADDYLAAVNAGLGSPAQFQHSVWACIMELLTKETLCEDLRADYYLSRGHSDKIILTWVDAGPNHTIELEMLYLEIGHSLCDEARARFDITDKDTGSQSIRLFHHTSPGLSTPRGQIEFDYREHKTFPRPTHFAGSFSFENTYRRRRRTHWIMIPDTRRQGEHYIEFPLDEWP